MTSGYIQEVELCGDERWFPYWKSLLLRRRLLLRPHGLLRTTHSPERCPWGHRRDQNPLEKRILLNHFSCPAQCGLCIVSGKLRQAFLFITLLPDEVRNVYVSLRSLTYQGTTKETKPSKYFSFKFITGTPLFHLWQPSRSQFFETAIFKYQKQVLSVKWGA